MPPGRSPKKPNATLEKQVPDMFRSNEEPRRGLNPLRIDLVEDRFEALRGKKLVKEEKTVQRFRHSPMKMACACPLR